MKLQLSVNIPKYPFRLNHNQQVFLMGSCFSEHISVLMLQHGFFVASNPWGILFNPLSLVKLADKLIQPTNISEAVIPVFRENRWFSLHQHSQMYADDENDLLHKIESETIKASNQFAQSEVLVVTFGTAFVYEYLERNQEIVANCQKLPSQRFQKRLLKIGEIVEVWSKWISQVSDKKIIFTISPVRHSKDGLIENNQSKATLHLAVKKLLELHPAKCFYFPAYEIVIDELRDYRFYQEDMVHPTLFTSKYVWDKWSHAFYDSLTLEMSMEFNKLYSFSKHKPMYEDVQLHNVQTFNMIKRCELCYPNMNYSVILG